MGTVPTNALERELRKSYLIWLAGLGRHEADLTDYVAKFERDSRAIITRMGGQAASLGALADFPVPKALELSPVADVVYDQMKQVAIKASIQAGLNATDTARQMLNVGLGQSFNRLNRLARTETVSAYWKNAWGSIEGLDSLVMLWGSEESKRTCPWCLERDGLVLTSPEIRDHPNGRCTPIPTLRSQVKYRGSVDRDGSIFHDPDWNKKKLNQPARPQEIEAPSLAGNLPYTDASQWLDDKAFLDHALRPEGVMSGMVGKDGSDVLLRDIWEKQGYRAKPTLIENLKRDERTIYRGVKQSGGSPAASEMIDQFKNGDEPFAGAGIFGNGTYFSNQFDRAVDYAGGDPGAVMAARWKADANLKTFDSLMDMAKWQEEQFGTALKEAQARLAAGKMTDDQVDLLRAAYMDPGRAASMSGVDGYRVKGPEAGEYYWVVQNRSMLEVEA